MPATVDKPKMRSREEILEELKRVTETIVDLDPVLQANTYVDLVRKKGVLRWVLGIE